MQTWQGWQSLDGGRFLIDGHERGWRKQKPRCSKGCGGQCASGFGGGSVRGAIMRGAGDLALLGLGGEGHGGDDLILLAMRRWCLGERRDGRQVGAGGNFHFLGGVS